MCGLRVRGTPPLGAPRLGPRPHTVSVLNESTAASGGGGAETRAAGAHARERVHVLRDTHPSIHPSRCAGAGVGTRTKRPAGPLRRRARGARARLLK